MNKNNLFLLSLIILVGILGMFLYVQLDLDQQDQVAVTPEIPESKPIKKPIIRYPVPEVVQPEPPEPITTSENEKTPSQPETPPHPPESIEQALEKIVKDSRLLALFNMEDFIQRFVVMVDNLPEKRLPYTHLPIKPPGGSFIVSGTKDAPQTSSRNHKRYRRYVDLLEKIDPEVAIKLYIYFYPSFQKAYEQLGYKNAYFNDRLVYTLDHLVETPQPKEPILLAQPLVLYTYADPLLENRSAGQKILIRIGPENRIKVMKILEDYHQRLKDLHP